MSRHRETKSEFSHFSADSIDLQELLGGNLMASMDMLEVEPLYTRERVARVQQKRLLPSMAALLSE